MAVALVTRLAAAVMGGNAVYSDLKSGDRFHFPTNPHGTIFIKLAGGWYVEDPATRKRPAFKFRTGRGTAVIKLRGA